MLILTRVVINIESGQVTEREGFEYTGPVAECISFGGNKSKQKSKQQSSSESGVRYNPDFMDLATQFANDTSNAPAYNPQYVKGDYTSGKYTGTNYTPLAPGGFDKLEGSLYDTQASKLSQAYNTAMANQREQLAQSGALNSPSQYLEGSARSSLDRTYMQNLQQAARDAALGRLGAEQTEAGRRTAYDVGEAGRRTAYDVGEAGRRTQYDTGEAARQTGFNEDTAARLLDLWLKKLGVAIEAGRYSTGQSTGQSSGDTMGGNFGLFQFGGSSTS